MHLLYVSHEKAAAAIAAGKFDDEIVPVEVVKRFVDDNGKYSEKKFIFEMDEGVRHGTSVEGLAKLRPAFSVTGSVTAGNCVTNIRRSRCSTCDGP